MFERRIHKVAIELPNFVEGLVGVQSCMYSVSTSNLSNKWYSEYNFSHSCIVPTVR